MLFFLCPWQTELTCSPERVLDAKRICHRAALCSHAGGAAVPIRCLRVTLKQVAQQLADLGWVADLVICSDSVRTRQTLDAMQDARVGLEVCWVWVQGLGFPPSSKHARDFDDARASYKPACAHACRRMYPVGSMSLA